MSTSAVVAAVPESIRAFIQQEEVRLVAVEPVKEAGTFSLYYAASDPYRVLHVSFDRYIFRAVTWCTSLVQPPELSAIVYSFLVRAGKSPQVARLEATAVLASVGLPFTFATIH